MVLGTCAYYYHSEGVQEVRGGTEEGAADCLDAASKSR